MTWARDQLAPRDLQTASRVAGWMCLVSSAVVMVSDIFLALSVDLAVKIVLIATPGALLVMGCLLLWSRFRYTAALVVLTPVVAAAMIAVLDLSTSDSSAGAQIAFCLPVLFTASQFPALSAAAMVLIAAGADAVVVFTQRPADLALVDLAGVTLVLVVMTVLLGHARRQQEELNAGLRRQASVDTLTGLVNRTVLDEAIRRALAEPTGTALILIDVDNFKSINDGYGHPVGDDALIHIATLLTRAARTDTVISRLGGDELAVLVPRCTEAESRERAHELLAAVLTQPLPLSGGTSLALSVSVGLAHTAGGRPLRELYSAADASLYEAKRAGRGRVGPPMLSLSPEGSGDRPPGVASTSQY